MAVLTSEAVILRTWPVQESDLIVSFFTRDYGKVKGVAKAALKSRKRFGGALEPMTLARAWFVERPRQELVRLDQLEILRSPLAEPVNYLRAAVLSFYAETLEETLPERDPQDAVYRLLYSVLDLTTSDQPWLPLTYFSLWMTRLMGWLPELTRCTLCAEPLNADDPGSYHAYADGLFCKTHSGLGHRTLSADSWQLAHRILRQPINSLAAEDFPRRRAADLRLFTLQSLERHLERRLRSADAINRISG
jgi:DNA repair protein RecO (recombination protein O)